MTIISFILKLLFFLLALVVIWFLVKFSIIKTLFAILKGKYAGTVYSYKLGKMRIMRKYGFIIGLILGIICGSALTWLLFIYNEGQIWQLVSEYTIKGYQFFSEKITDGFLFIKEKAVFISPYGRLQNPDSKFLYVLNIASIEVGIFFIITLFCVYNYFEDFYFIKTICSIIYGVLHWYISFGVCFLIVKIEIYYKVLSAILISIAVIVVWFILLFVFSLIFDALE